MENSTANINQGRPVYFSYARNSKRKPEWEHISDSVDTLLETMTAYNLEYRVDVKDIGMGDKISKFEEEIGWKSEVVVIIFSDKYFRSPHCMYEFVQIKNALQNYPEKRLMCIKSGDFNLADSNYIMDLEQFWVNQKNEYERIEFHRLRNHSGTEIAAHENGFYLEEIRNLYSFFSAINYSNAASINYDSFVGDIVKYYKTTPKPLLTPKPPKYSAQQPTSTAQSQPKQETAQNIQRLAGTSQPSFPQKKTIAIAAAAVLIVVICILAGGNSSTELPPATDNNGSIYAFTSTPEDYTNILRTANGYYDADKYSEAITYYEKVADKITDAEDQHHFAYCYDELNNYEKAAEWYQKSADQGYEFAQYCLGLLYQDGEGVPQNYEKAAELFQMAADQGDKYSQYRLGLCYRDGEGVPKNLKKAKEYFTMAAKQGHKNATEALKAL